MEIALYVTLILLLLLWITSPVSDVGKSRRTFYIWLILSAGIYGLGFYVANRQYSEGCDSVLSNCFGTETPGLVRLYQRIFVICVYTSITYGFLIVIYRLWLSMSRKLSHKSRTILLVLLSVLLMGASATSKGLIHFSLLEFLMIIVSIYAAIIKIFGVFPRSQSVLKKIAFFTLIIIFFSAWIFQPSAFYYQQLGWPGIPLGVISGIVFPLQPIVMLASIMESGSLVPLGNLLGGFFSLMSALALFYSCDGEPVDHSA